MNGRVIAHLSESSSGIFKLMLVDHDEDVINNTRKVIEITCCLQSGSRLSTLLKLDIMSCLLLDLYHMSLLFSVPGED